MLVGDVKEKEMLEGMSGVFVSLGCQNTKSVKEVDVKKSTINSVMPLLTSPKISFIFVLGLIPH